MQVIHEVIH